MRRMISTAAAILVAAPALAEPTITMIESTDPQLALGEVTFEGGKTLTLTHGIGSGAYRRASDPDDRFVTISDRGANFTCGDTEDVIGIDGKKFCGDIKRGRIYALPDYSPSIYTIVIEGGAFKIESIVPLKDQDGTPVTGMPNPLTVATTETPLDAKGRKLEQSPSSVDAEAIVQLADGTFWIGEENAPSILHVAADGTIQKRIVPAGTEKDFAGAAYEVVGGLPAILAKRQANRGIESLALMPDGKTLLIAMQSPLANPDSDAYEQSRNMRLFTFDIPSQTITSELAYVMTDMRDFPGEEKKKPNTARVSELLAIDQNRVLLLDRTDKTTRIYEVDLSEAGDILGTLWDDITTTPTMEQADLGDAGIRPVKARLVLDSSKHPELPPKIEGMAWFANGDLLLVNDNDFGITGARTELARVAGLDIER